MTNNNKDIIRNTRTNNFKSDAKDKLDINKQAVKTIAPLSLVGLFGVNASADDIDTPTIQTKTDQSLLANLDQVELNNTIRNASDAMYTASKTAVSQLDKFSVELAYQLKVGTSSTSGFGLLGVVQTTDGTLVDRILGVK